MKIFTKDQGVLIGQRIKRARTLAGLSRKDLDSYGISAHTIQSWELGRNPLHAKKAAKLVEIFHKKGISCSVDWLLEGTGSSPSILGETLSLYPKIDHSVGHVLNNENVIQQEIEHFKLLNANAKVIMISDDAMEPRYVCGDYVGGIAILESNKFDECVGYDCIVETPDGLFFRRFGKRDSLYLLSCLNHQTKVSEPLIMVEKILSIAPVVWHRWRYESSKP